MKTVELSGVRVADVGSLWHDLLKKDFDVETVGATGDSTFIYLADDEDKDPRPVAEDWIGKVPVTLNKSAVLERRKAIQQLLDKAKVCRAERSAARAAMEAAEEAARIARERAAAPVAAPAPAGGAAIDADMFEPEQPLPPVPASAPAQVAGTPARPKVGLVQRIFRVFRS